MHVVLSQCTLTWHLSPKSIDVYQSNRSFGRNEGIPLHVRNTPTKLMKCGENHAVQVFVDATLYYLQYTLNLKHSHERMKCMFYYLTCPLFETDCQKLIKIIHNSWACHNLSDKVKGDNNTKKNEVFRLSQQDTFLNIRQIFFFSNIQKMINKHHKWVFLNFLPLLQKQSHAKQSVKTCLHKFSRHGHYKYRNH